MLKPLGRNLLVKIEVVEKRGSLFIPGSAQDSEQVVRVVAVGPKCEEPIQVGDAVIISRETRGLPSKDDDGKEYVFVHENAVYGIRTFGEAKESALVTS